MARAVVATAAVVRATAAMVVARAAEAKALEGVALHLVWPDCGNFIFPPNIFNRPKSFQLFNFPHSQIFSPPHTPLMRGSSLLLSLILSSPLEIRDNIYLSLSTPRVRGNSEPPLFASARARRPPRTERTWNAACYSIRQLVAIGRWQVVARGTCNRRCGNAHSAVAKQAHAAAATGVPRRNRYRCSNNHRWRYAEVEVHGAAFQLL